MNTIDAVRHRWRMPLAGLAAALVAGTLGLPLTSSAQAAEAEEPASLVTPDTTWRYLADDTDPGTTADPRVWTDADFDDSAWQTGKGGFGGKRDAETESPVFDDSRTAATHLLMRPNGMTANVRTYYFRTTFEVSAQEAASTAVLKGSAYVDDAARIYVNGTQVQRHNMEDDTPNLAYDTGSGGPLTVSIPGSALKAGENTLAVAVHQDRASSSDIWWSLDSLVAQPIEPSRIILTPTETPETSQSFTWLAALPDDTVGKVQIRPAGGGATRTVAAAGQGTAMNQANPHFSATVRGLKPATGYSYRVGNAASGWSDWAEFSTADPKETDFSYVYYGDAQIGLDSTWPKVVKMAEDVAPDSIGSVHAGDLIDTASNDSQWDNWFTGMKRSAATTNIFAAPGNHEYSGDKLMRSWKAHFEYPDNNPHVGTIGDLAELAVGDTDVARQYASYFDHWSDFARETVYYADYQGVRFITINATRDTTFLRPDALPACEGADCPSTKVAQLWTQFQAAWLDHVLENSDSKWNVVTFHQPVYSTSAGRNEPVLREHWVPVFQKHDIDLVQMGHDHTYARGFNDADTTDQPGVTDGPVYVVSNSGAKHYDLETDERNVWTNNGATQVLKGENITTFQVVSVSQDKLVYKSYLAEKVDGARTVPAKDLEVGQVIDSFEVHKHDDGRKRVIEAGAPAPDFEDLTPAPVITGQPKSVAKAKIGSTVEFDVRVAEPEAATYQWQRQVRGATSWSDIRNQDESTLVLEDVTPNTARYAYRVAVTAGSHTVHSSAATLAVQPPKAAPKKARVTVSKALLRDRRSSAVWGRGSADGTAKVVVTRGRTRIVRTVPVRADRTVKVRLGTLRGTGATARVSVVLSPRDRTKHLRASTAKLVTVKRG